MALVRCVECLYWSLALGWFLEDGTLSTTTLAASRNASVHVEYAVLDADKCLADFLESVEVSGCQASTRRIRFAWSFGATPAVANTAAGAYLDALLYRTSSDHAPGDSALLRRAKSTARKLGLHQVSAYVELLDLIPETPLTTAAVSGVMEKLHVVAEAGDARLTALAATIVLNKLSDSNLATEVDRYREYLRGLSMQTVCGQFSWSLWAVRFDQENWWSHASSAFAAATSIGHTADRILHVSGLAMERCIARHDYDGAMQWAMSCEPSIDRCSCVHVGFEFAAQLLRVALSSAERAKRAGVLAERLLVSIHQRDFERFHRVFLMAEETLRLAGRAGRGVEFGRESLVSLEACSPTDRHLWPAVHGAIATSADAAGDFELAAYHASESVSQGFEGPYVWRVLGESLARQGLHGESAQILCACSQRFVTDVGWPAGFYTADLAVEQYFLSGGFAAAAEFIEYWIEVCVKSRTLPKGVRKRVTYHVDQLWADLYMRDGQFKDAVRKLKAAEKLAKSVGEVSDYLTLVNRRAVSLVELGSQTAAFKLWKDTIAACDGKIRQDSLTDIVDSYASALEAAGDAAEAGSIRGAFGRPAKT